MHNENTSRRKNWPFLSSNERNQEERKAALYSNLNQVQVWITIESKQLLLCKHRPFESYFN